MPVAGLEKFSHLEDKIYRTVELCKTLKFERDNLERELVIIRREFTAVQSDRDRLEAQLERLLADRDSVRLKVEAMLDAISVLETEAEVVKK
jgi:FtsZ-binding cell division protein ZapB